MWENSKSDWQLWENYHKYAHAKKKKKICLQRAFPRAGKVILYVALSGDWFQNGVKALPLQILILILNNFLLSHLDLQLKGNWDRENSGLACIWETFGSFLHLKVKK